MRVGNTVRIKSDIRPWLASGNFTTTKESVKYQTQSAVQNKIL